MANFRSWLWRTQLGAGTTDRQPSPLRPPRRSDLTGRVACGPLEPMDSLLDLGWFGGLVSFVGWALGIVGFFIARSARSDLRQLRRTLAEQNSRQPAAVAVEPEIVPPAPSDPEPFESPAVVAEIPAPEPAFVPHGAPRDLEALLTTPLGVWSGSAALLFAGIFLVRYAVEQALLGPAARCVAAALLGLILLVAAEWLHRHEGPPLAGPLRIDQAPSALAARAGRLSCLGGLRRRSAVWAAALADRVCRDGGRFADRSYGGGFALWPADRGDRDCWGVRYAGAE